MFSNSKSGKFALSLPPVAFDFVRVFTALINKSFGMVSSCECNHAFLDYNTLSNNLRLWLFLAQSTSECLQKRSFVSFLNCHQKTFSVIFLDSTVTHCPSTLCPQWYFRFPNLLSSICTIFPSPPSFWLLWKSDFTHFAAEAVPVNTNTWGQS